MKEKRERITYLPNIVSYDIETSKFGDQAFPYSQCFSVDGEVYLMRTIQEMVQFIDQLRAKFNTTPTKCLVIYVHNLSYEFSFMQEYFVWDEDGVFAIGKNNKIAKARTNGIEFRCSALLTGTTLANVGYELGFPKGDLDYDKVRHHETPLTEDELDYIYKDVQILDKELRRRLKNDTLTTIPLTKTGYIRRQMNTAVRNDKAVSRLISGITLTVEDYKALKQTFRGGYTHANPRHMGKVIHNVKGFDLGSSYPSSMTKNKYPMSSFINLVEPKIEYMDTFKHTKCIMVDLTFYNYNCNYNFPPMSESKCIELKGGIIDNGRVDYADKMRVSITDIDYETLLRCSTWDDVEVHEMRIADAKYLPKPVVEVVLSNYGLKTELKGIEGREDDYKMAKENTNSTYGLMAADPIHMESHSDSKGNIIVTEDEDAIYEEVIKYNNKKGRAQCYQWGTWVTAHSRAMLLHTIYDLIDVGVIVVYCDTDSIYYIDHKSAMEVINKSNEAIKQAMSEAVKYHGFGEDIIEPKSKTGDKYYLGLWEAEDNGIEYLEFKTLGAKRYMKSYRKGDKVVTKLTLSGVSKDKGGEYILLNGGFDAFDHNLVIPAGHSGKKVVTKSRDVCSGLVTDYLGNTTEVHHIGFTTIREADYQLSISEDYSNFCGNLSQSS